MAEQNSPVTAESLLQAHREQRQQRYTLRLFVAGTTERSQRAFFNLRRICEQYLVGRYELEVIDIYQQPGLASRAEVVAAPTLVKALPPPLRRIIGDLSQTEKVLVGLQIQAGPEASQAAPDPKRS